ncbi:PREDICTED: nucleoside diphosphate kinase 6 [Nicrophorus vespilloides]|uniref:Nucleoside diphosphate kinase 6 n=1 Tax=Nicrophorus vespilloides TaxID=110193 RepID=A0ABM1MHZ8_NICVS|nr:PREDICTED: nucleoside diphosphate kinase 6 [Nicrophorus vespilloides]
MLAKGLQLTLAIIKPHVVCQPVALQDIRRMILAADFKVVRSERKRLSLPDAERFYSEHEGKFFYNRLTTFMTSGPIDLYILARRDGIKEWRKLMGPTKVFRTQFFEPETIRGKFGLSDTRNATHGSDSDESAKKEIGLFFPRFDFEGWHRDEEIHYRDEANLILDEEEFVHTIADNNNA